MSRSLLQYIENSPTAFHAVENLRQMLLQEGYVDLPQGTWTLQPGGKYMLTVNASSIIAFRIPDATPSGFMMAAAHSDSPCFLLHHQPEITGDYVRLSAEKYGGMLAGSWFDRPLSIAGRAMVRTENGIRSQLVDFKKDMVLLPNVAIHLSRDAANGVKYDAAHDYIPLYGGKDSAGSFYDELAELLACPKDDIVAADLMVYNNQCGTIWGAQGEFLSAPRLDDLACAFGAAEAFLQADEASVIPVLCVFNNEEIGSETRQGAASCVLYDTLHSIAQALCVDYNTLLSESFLLSCDNGHAKHPNHPELANAVDAPVLNGGIIIKHSPRYATDAVSDAVFSEICRRTNVPVQHYANRPDQAGGATLGNIAATKVPVPTVDIGMAQLAMHSCFETMGTCDYAYFVNALQAFFGTVLQAEGNLITIS